MPRHTMSRSAPYQCPGCNLAGHNFNGQDLTNANLAGAILTGAVLSGCVLTGANFAGASLGGANFSGCDLTAATFDSPANFTCSPVQVTNFENATLPYSVLGSVWDNMNLTNATVVNLPGNLTQLSAVNSILVGQHFGKRRGKRQNV